MARINCHSAFKHYEMFHSRGGDVINIGSNNTTIFNCGGSHLGGFWGGFGLGLGNAFGSLFSGMFSGGYGMGGFSCLPSFGGGWGNFGGGWASPWGAGNNSRVSDTSSRTSSTECHCKKDDTPEKKNIDNAKFADLTGQLKDLQQKENVTPEEIQAVIDKVQEARNKEDGIEGVNDKKTYDNLLATLKDMKAKAEKAKAAPVEQPATRTSGQTEGVDGADGAGGAGDIKKTLTSGDNEPTVTINGKPVKLSDLTADQIKGLTEDQINGLTPEQAKALLDKLGLLNDGKNGVKATTNLAALRLVAKSGLPLSCGHNIALDNVKNSDPYINGKISDVKYDDTTKTITFIIDDDNAKYKMSCKADDSTYQIAELVENKTNKYKSVKIGTEYEIKEDDNDDYAVRNGEAAIK